MSMMMMVLMMTKGLIRPFLGHLGYIMSLRRAMMLPKQGQVGAKLGYIRTSWGYVGTFWGYVVQ
eukprot:7508526-Karenia_brevis.AAC.1